MNKKLVVFNWKMAPSSLKKAEDLFSSAKKFKNKNAEFVICPPFEYLEPLLKHSKNKTIKAGAQDVFYKEKGAYTGEISPRMLKNLSVEYVIIGHSERRKFLNETDEIVNKKIKAALKAGLKVILCVGEPTRAISDKGQEIRKAENYVKTQLQKDLKGIANLPINKLTNSLIIAYEPIWAIGTGHNDTPDDAREMINFIKSFLVANGYLLKPIVLYGGSVDSKNIQKFLQYKKIDGALVGHASTDKKELGKILKIATSH